MILVTIGTDRKIFEEGSGARARMIEYGTLFTELHIIIFTLRELNLQPQKISDNVWIYPTQSRSRFFYPFNAAKLFKTISKDHPAAVVSTQDPFETGLAGWLIKRRNPTLKLHMQIHTDFMSKYFYRSSRLNRIRVMLARWLLPKANAIRAVSARIKNSLAAIDPSLPGRTSVLPIYTDIAHFMHDEEGVNLHERYPQFSFIILMASRLTTEKNIKLALESLQEIVLKHKDVGLVIVGDGPEKRYLEGLALRYHLDRNVIFEPWQKSLVSHYRTADVFLTTSLYEGYGLTLMEAAAAGCPIITSDVGIAEQLVFDGKNGFIGDLQNPGSFADALKRMIEDKNLYHSLKNGAEKVAHEQVNEPKEVYLRKYKDMIEQAL